MVYKSLGTPKKYVSGKRLQCNHSSKMHVSPKTQVLNIPPSPLVITSQTMNCVKLYKAHKAGKVLLFQANNEEMP